MLTTVDLNATPGVPNAIYHISLLYNIKFDYNISFQTLVIVRNHFFLSNSDFDPMGVQMQPGLPHKVAIYQV
jgi:hypothetical protein